MSAISSLSGLVAGAFGVRFGFGFFGLLGPGVGFGSVGGFFISSGSSSSIEVTASSGIIPSSISSFGMLVGPKDVVLIKGVTILSGAFLSS